MLDKFQNNLCQQSTCSQNLVCNSEPQKLCQEYGKKTICIEEEDYCPKEELSCTDWQIQCLQEGKVCFGPDKNRFFL